MVAIREMRRAAIKGGTVATAQSQIAHALLIQFKFIHHKPVMMHAFHDDWEPLAIVRAREKAEKTLGAKFNIRAFHDAVLELGSVPRDCAKQAGHFPPALCCNGTNVPRSTADVGKDVLSTSSW